MAARKKNSGSGSSLLTLGALAVGGYFLYEWLFAPSATAAAPAAAATTPTGTTAAASTAPPVPAGSGPPPPPAPATGGTLDAIYQKILSTAAPDPNFTGAGSNLTGSAYQFDVYLTLAAPSLVIPDPNTVFGSSAAAIAPMTAAAYWALMAPALQSANPSAGLAGLGCFGGVGAYMRGLGAYQW